MATNKPRIQVTLEPETHALLTELSSIQSRSMSSVVSEVLTASLPAMRLMINMLKASQGIQGLAHDQWLASLEADELYLKDKISEVCFNASTDLDKFIDLSSIERSKASEERERVSAPGGALGVDPLCTNRGVRSTINSRSTKVTNTSNILTLKAKEKDNL